MYLTAPGKPGLAYLEHRGQVLSHFQCFSLHRVNHILHPGAGEAAGPATGREGQPGRDRESEKIPAAADAHRHPAGGTRGDGTRRDATGRTRRGGGAASANREGRARAAHHPGSARRTGPRCHLAAREGGGDEGRIRGERRAHAHPSPSRELSSPPCFTRAPSGFPFSLSRRSSAATWASRDSGLSRHVTRERARWGGLRPLLPSFRKRNTERACAMGTRSNLSQSGRYCAFCSGIGGSGAKTFSLSFLPIVFPTMDPKNYCCFCGATQLLPQL